MADKTPDQLTATTSVADTDLLLVYALADAVLKKLEFSVFLQSVLDGLTGDILQAANNLSDLGNSTTARANLGLGSAALLASGALFQVANNLSELQNAETARTNLGAVASSAGVMTGGFTLTGAQKGNVQALSGTEIDVSVAECFTKSISANTTFTFTGATSGKFQGFILELTISSSAVPTFPTSVQWAGGSDPDPGDGKHEFGFFTTDGGTSWVGVLGASAVS